MLKRFHGFLAAILICSLFFPGLVHAQDDKPLWWHNLECRDDEKLFSGLEHCTGKSPYEYIHVIVIQLDSSGLQVQYIIPNGVNGKGISGECKDVNTTVKHPAIGCSDPKNQTWYPVIYMNQAVDKAQRASNLAVVINGDYSACTNGPSSDCPLVDNKGKLYYREHGPEGLTVVNGSRLDGFKNGDGDDNIVNRPYLVISRSTPISAEIHQSASDKDGLNPYSWAYTGIGGAPWLVQNGKALPNLKDCAGANKSSCRDNVSQTAVGLTLDKKWMFLVLAVDASTLTEVATFMDEKLDVWQAIKFDGGGSSQLYYAGASDPYVETGDGRPLTNFLAIHAPPGKGIFSDNPSEPSTTPDDSDSPSNDDLSWWQKIQEGWTNFWNGVGNWWQDRVEWWNGVKKDFTNWWEGVKTWWQELPQRIEDWVLQQFIDWLSQRLNQLCGSAGLIPATMAIVVYARKRYHR